MGNNTNVVCLLVKYGGWSCTKANAKETSCTTTYKKSKNSVVSDGGFKFPLHTQSTRIFLNWVSLGERWEGGVAPREGGWGLEISI
jgi:hypothetical protein